MASISLSVDKILMRFINNTGNTVNLNDVNIAIPYIGKQDQFIDPDIVKKSPSLQTLILSHHFTITEASEERIEQNLLRVQQRRLNLPSNSDDYVKVVFRGQFSGNTGYSKSNINMVLGLARNGVAVSIDPVGKLDAATIEERSRLERLHTIPSDKAILIHSTIPSFAEHPGSRYSILYTTVESATVPKQFVDATDMYNEVWVVSDFCKSVLVNAGVTKPIYVIPNGVDTRLYNERAKQIDFKPELKPFRFISVFGWNYRKGYDVLLKAYLQEFRNTDPTSLLIVSKYQMNGDGTRKRLIEKEIREFITKYGGTEHPHVARSGIEIKEYDMPRLYRSCQCFVLPSRGEGFGLPYMEASLCGLPVIGTNYSGQSMFLNQNNSFLIDIDKVSEQHKTNVHFWDGQVFPELCDESVINSLRAQMRYVFENYTEAKRRNKILQDEIIAGYSSDFVSGLARQRLEEIWRK